jgi:hypothetical protein
LSLCLTKHSAMKTYWGSGCIAPRILEHGTRWRWVVSFTLRPLCPKERTPGTHWIGGWVGSRTVLETVVKRKFPSPLRESKTRTPIVQPVAQRYIDWAITALTWKEVKVVTLLKPRMDPKFPQNLRPISLLPTTGKLSEKVIQKNSPNATRWIRPTKCNSIWLSCTLQHDTCVWGLRIAWPLTLIIIYPQLQYYWISKKPLTLHGTLACWTVHLNYNFRQIWWSLLAHS